MRAMETGLVSVSFRNLSPQRIVALAKQADLNGIEWGGDVHVPAGDVETARAVRDMTAEAGLQVFAYGSYFRPGEQRAEEFKPVLVSAKTLGAPVVRVWAGAKWSWRADEAYVQRVIADTQAICDLAAKEDITISYEYHGWTLTDNRFSATEVHREIGRQNMALYWQPNFCLTTEENLLALRMVLPRMRDVHVFNWDCLGARFPLEEASEFWRTCIETIRRDERKHRLMLEFFRDDSAEQFLRDAQTLNQLVEI